MLSLYFLSTFSLYIFIFLFYTSSFQNHFLPYTVAIFLLNFSLHFLTQLISNFNRHFHILLSLIISSLYIRFLTPHSLNLIISFVSYFFMHFLFLFFSLLSHSNLISHYFTCYFLGSLPTLHPHSTFSLF